MTLTHRKVGAFWHVENDDGTLAASFAHEVEARAFEAGWVARGLADEPKMDELRATVRRLSDRVTA